jgi:transposase
MSRERRTLSAAFKAKVALEAIREQKTINQLAAEYELHPNQISQWKKLLLENSALVFDPQAGRHDTESEKKSDELFRQIGQLKVENDWLKKKTAQFLGQKFS